MYSDFFAIIQLNSQPFRVATGPISDSEAPITMDVANNCIIRNGVIGLSSHQSILGNNNRNIIIEKINCEDFEVSGIILNNVTNCYIENSIIGQSIGVPSRSGSTRNLHLSPYFAGFMFTHRLLNQALNLPEKFPIDIVYKDSIIKLSNKLKDVLTLILDKIYTTRN